MSRYVSFFIVQLVKKGGKDTPINIGDTNKIELQNTFFSIFFHLFYNLNYNRIIKNMY